MISSFINLFLANPVGQALGILATVTYLYSAVQKSDKKLQGIMLIGAILWVAHYSFLAAWVAAFSYLIGIVRNGLIFFGVVNSKNRVFLTSMLIVLYLVAGYFTIRTPIELIPTFCASLYAIALLNLEGIPMRSVMMVSQVTWVFYGWVIGSIGGVATASAEFVLTLYTVSSLWFIQRPEVGKLS